MLYSHDTELVHCAGCEPQNQTNMVPLLSSCVTLDKVFASQVQVLLTCKTKIVIPTLYSYIEEKGK